MLARNGVKVALVERATFPRDTLSTHNFEADALAFLNRLGVTKQLRATGAPFVRRIDARAGDLTFSMDFPQRPGDVGGTASIRRFILDPILEETAAEAGADVRMATNVTGLMKDRGRVVGVRADGKSGETAIHARLVVGADGRNSAVASFAGARKYNLTANQRFFYWAFFEGADIGDEPTLVLHRWNDRYVIAAPVDSGLYMVVVVPDLAELVGFRTDLEGRFMAHALSCAPVARALGPARRTGKFLGTMHWTGFFREAAGPGWVLAGDAGHFKDPSAGRGIGDAFRQVDSLAPAITAGLAGTDIDLDKAMTDWGRWRDREFAEHHWFAQDLGKAGHLPAVLPEILRGLHARGRIGEFVDLFAHRSTPSRVLTPPRLVRATGRLLIRRGVNRGALLKETWALVAEDARHRLRNRRPDYAAPGRAVEDAGPTEVEHTAV